MKYFIVTFLPPEGDRAPRPSCLALPLAVVFSLSLVNVSFKVVKTPRWMSSWGAEVGVMPADRGKSKHKVVVRGACAARWNESPAGCCLHGPLCTKQSDEIQDWQFCQCSRGAWDKVPLLAKSSCQAPGTDSKRAATDLSYCLGGITCSAVMIFWPEHIQKTHHHRKVNRALRWRKIR